MPQTKKNNHMTTKEAVEKIKSMIFGDMVPAEPVIPASGNMAPNVAPQSGVESKFEDYKLKSGAVVSIDKLDVGGSVTLNGEPAPDGEHEFEDGTKIVVAGGLITDVKKAEVAPVVEVEVEAMKKLPGMFSEMEQGFAAAKTDIAELRSTIAKQNGTIEKQAEALKQMFSLVETIANSSIEQPTEPVKSFEEMSPLEKFRAQKTF
jgi:uncharacterized coiled-coil protein SlyX